MDNEKIYACKKNNSKIRESTNNSDSIRQETMNTTSDNSMNNLEGSFCPKRPQNSSHTSRQNKRTACPTFPIKPAS